MVVDNPKPQYTPGLEHSVRIFIQEITYSNHAVEPVSQQQFHARTHFLVSV